MPLRGDVQRIATNATKPRMMAQVPRHRIMMMTK
jgi:hypothetical protein